MSGLAIVLSILFILAVTRQARQHPQLDFSPPVAFSAPLSPNMMDSLSSKICLESAFFLFFSKRAGWGSLFFSRERSVALSASRDTFSVNDMPVWGIQRLSFGT